LLKQTIRHLLNLAGPPLLQKSSINHFIEENEQLQRRVNGLEEERERLLAELRKHEDLKIFHAITEDYQAHEKMKHVIDHMRDFGKADFAELACCIFAASISNGRIIGQRINEGALLWRAVKMSGGPILEVGRYLGGSTLVLLGASDSRPVVSIDREPIHVPIADIIFKRPDVSSRLKLYELTSREPIAETEFGMIFIDGDHSYPGICQDIATFWNTLKPFEGRPPLAAFHDGADNPITYVETVKHACEELLAEPGVARVVESWGSMLLLEKTANIDPDRWYAKDHLAFWEQYASPKYPVLKPIIFCERLHPGQPAVHTTSVELLGKENVEYDSWEKRGVRIERAQLTEDNPLRLLRETPEKGEHGIEKSIALNLSQLKFSVFLRPHHLEALRLSILDSKRFPLAQVDFELTDRSRIGKAFAKDEIEIVDAGFLLRNGYFGCDLAVRLPAPISSAIFAVNALNAATEKTYLGDEDRGFFVNLFSVKEIS